ncbi:uncharacterized protein LOC134530861 [Bacillus rossius redtenbacheri]|uniref:uncharacterized protein LOC134530861 n=1 Tax=Bacillus rossius redtenbacheri TaxID=93214 RepID=UPI002FDCF374
MAAGAPLLLLLVLLLEAAAAPADHAEELSLAVAWLVRRWAPLVWLHPEERFLPLSVPEFLQHVEARGGDSEAGFLVAHQPLDSLLANGTSFLHGRDPSSGDGVPVYALVRRCNGSGDDQPLSFHVTYWMFYPYSEGKPVCTLLGLLPLPQLRGRCLGSRLQFGGHVGDWEHLSLLFQGSGPPTQMYVSAHDAGAYYVFDAASSGFVLERQEVRRGVLQRPAFPARVELAAPRGHPELFAARGSHGLWAQPGRHQYVAVPRLHDEAGRGAPWRTWRRLQLVGDSEPRWMAYRGRWGNPRSGCHPLARRLCRSSDGPTGIPLKRPNFSCPPPP